MRFPLDKVYVTQEWGVNPQMYSKYGLKGHNGVDFGLHEEDTKIYAPHDGVVIEARYDTGYGWYVKIENGKEGSILAHFKTNSIRVITGQKVREGDWVAIGGNTGNSTGPHLHWGYYPIPRQRDNGYSGTVDQLPLLKQNPVPEPGPDLLPKRSVVNDMYQFLCGMNATEKELDWRMKSGLNLVQIGNDICGGDSRFKERWGTHEKEVVVETKEVEVITDEGATMRIKEIVGTKPNAYEKLKYLLTLLQG